MGSRNNLRLVSFDGGDGARAFSQLRIMGQIMQQLRYDRNPNESDKFVLPCDHFDLMGGSGTGGLIAIMFARLRMSVQEIYDEFLTIVDEVYQPQDLSPSERTQKLRKCMENVMERKGLPIDMKFAEKPKPGDCASFVIASLRTDAANKICLRSYPVRSQLSSTITVIEAVLATCAMPPRFSSVISGSGYDMVEYIGASLGATNPVREVITEAHTLFGGDSGVASLLSLGIGHPGVISFPSGDGVDLNKVMRDMMNDCEQRAQETERQIGRVGIYFRFSVEQGMQNDLLGPVADPNQVVAQTKNYLAEQRIGEKIGDFIRNFDTATRLITLDQLEYAGGSTISIESAATLEAILAALELDHEDAILAKLEVPDLECGPHTAECMPGTRRDILERIETWTTDFNAPNILWLKGHPGVGKSAVAFSLVKQLKTAGRLGSCFFFQRQRSNVMTTNALWRTVAHDLAHEYPTVRKRLVAALEADESIPTAFNADRLFRQLIRGPLLASQEVPVERLPVIVVDALDECGGLEGEHSSHRRKLMRTLQLWSSLPPKFKLIVTSRDESDIASIFLRMNHHPVEISAGQTVEAQSSEDIRTFLTHRFQQIALRYPGSLSPNWPGPEVIIQMTNTAAGLFIWGETVVRFIGLGEPMQRLGLVLEGDGTGDMASLYEQILRTSFGSLSSHEVENLCSVLGAIILAKTPLSFSTLVSLLSLDDSTVEQICIGLQSVLESQRVLIFHHQSFSDFLIDPVRRTSKFFVKRREEARTLTLACLRTMKDELRFNICNLKSSYFRNIDISHLALRVEECIRSHVSYSSCFWADHLAEATFDIQVFEALQYFMENQFLFWLEVLSLIRRVNRASGMLLKLTIWIKDGNQDDTFAKDMRKFVVGFSSVISQSAPHIYLSGLPFSPQNSAVSKQYMERYPRAMVLQAGGLSRWPSNQSVLSGHTSSVRSVAFSPDGKRIASGSNDKSIRVWDAETGEAVTRPIEGHSGAVTSVVFSPDGKRIISGSWDMTIWLWDAETGEAVLGPFNGHSDWISTVAFSSDGRRIASGSRDKTIRVWDATTGEVVAGPFNGHSNWVTSVAFSPNNKTIVSGSEDRTIRVWDAETGEVLAGPLKGHNRLVTSVAFSPDGTHVISGSGDTTIRVWNPEHGQMVAGPFEGHSEVVESVAFSPDGKCIASGSLDKTIRVWDAKTGELVVGPLEGHYWVRSIAFSPDGTRIVAGSGDNMIRVWDVETGDLEAGRFEGHKGLIECVTFSPDGKYIASSSNDMTILVWDAETGKAVTGPLEGHRSSVVSIAFSPDASRIVSGSYDNTIRVWDAKMGELVMGPLEGHSSVASAIAFSPDGRLIVSGSADKTIRVWDAQTGEVVLGPLEGHGNWISSVSFSPDGAQILSGSIDKTIRVWDAVTGNVVTGPLECGGGVRSVAFSPDGKHIVSGSEDMMVRVWDAKTGEIVVGPLEGHSGWVKSVSFSPKGNCVASGSEDGTIRVWDAETGEMILGPLKGHSGPVNSVTFSPDGQCIVSGSEDMTIRVWNIMKYDSNYLKHNLPSFTGSSVMQDGWVLGPNSELLFWVPPTLRRGLFWPNNNLVIGDFIKTRLDFKLFVHGESWAQCRE